MLVTCHTLQKYLTDKNFVNVGSSIIINPLQGFFMLSVSPAFGIGHHLRPCTKDTDRLKTDKWEVVRSFFSSKELSKNFVR